MKASDPQISKARQGAQNDRGKTAAFFDLDGTLIMGTTPVLLVKFLRRVGVVSRGFLLGTALWFVGYRMGLLKATEKSRGLGGRVFTGKSEAEIADLMERFVEEVLVGRLHPGAWKALEQHQAKGDRVAMISAALEPVVKAVCRRLDIDEYAGSTCEIENGRYTGRLLEGNPHGERKAVVAKEYLARWGMDPANCWAYADHPSDEALLRSVGNPVAVNPKPGLLAIASEAGWPILP